MCKEPNYKIWYVSRACRKYLYSSDQEAMECQLWNGLT